MLTVRVHTQPGIRIDDQKGTILKHRIGMHFKVKFRLSVLHPCGSPGSGQHKRGFSSDKLRQIV